MEFSPYLEGLHHVVHLRTIAYQVKPLIVSGPPTLKLKHLLYVVEEASQCLVLAVEVYVYFTCDNGVLHRHFFVSKADTSGLGTRRLSAAGIIAQFIKYLVSLAPDAYLANVSWRKQHQTETTASAKKSEFSVVNTLMDLSHQLKSDPAFYDSILFYHARDLPLSRTSAHSTDKRWNYNSISTSLSLFTRSANAYIFPKSEKNPGKHVADGNGLLKWWISVLHKSLGDCWDCKADIPGSDPQEVRRYLPKASNWSVGNIYTDDNLDLAVFRIPVFPDDPKGRFLEHLIVEGRYKNVTQTQFWNELGYRQEFRLGNTVGIIGCVQKFEQALSSEAENATVVSLRTYKRIIELIKGQNFSIKEDIQSLTRYSLPEMFRRLGVNISPLRVDGKKKQVQGQTDVSASDSLKTLKHAVEPNNVSGLVKKRKPEVNNISGLIRKRTRTTNGVSAPNETRTQPTSNITALISEKTIPVNNINGLVKRKTTTKEKHT